MTVACGSFHPATSQIAGQVVTDARLDEEQAWAEVVFVGVAIYYSKESPSIDPHGDYATPIAYRVLERLKGQVDATVTVYHRARLASPTIDDSLRIRGEVFGGERPLVVFARSEHGRLFSRDREMDSDATPLGIVAATSSVLAHLRHQPVGIK